MGKRKHEEDGMTSIPRDVMPPERSSDTSASISDALKQFENLIQVKVNTDELLQKLQETVKNLQQKEKKLKKKVKKYKSKVVQNKEWMKKIQEDYKREIDEYKDKSKLELQEEIQKLQANFENKIKQDFSVFMEDFKRESAEYKAKSKEDFSVFMEDFKKELEEIKKEPDESRRFILKIQSKVQQVVFKGKPIRTVDSDHLEVVLYDGDNPIAPNHRLASAVVELVVLDGDFNDTQGFWSKDYFESKIMIPRLGSNPIEVKNGKFNLIGGKCHHQDATIADNSNRKDVKLGVRIVGDERALEGVSTKFRVQEAKTEKGKRTPDEVAQDLPRSTTGPNLITNKNGQGQQSCLPTWTNFSGIRPPQHIAYIAQTSGYGSAYPVLVSGLPQHGTTQPENHGYGSKGPLLATGLPQRGTTQPKNGSRINLNLGLSTPINGTGPSPGDVFDKFCSDTSSLQHLNLFGNMPVAADPGGQSAGNQYLGTDQLLLGYSGELQLPGVLPRTENGGVTVPAPLTVAPAPKGTQMDFTQAMAPGSLAP